MPNRARRLAVVLGSLILLALPLSAQEPASPIPREWLTPAEIASFEATPSYDETLAFLRKVQTRLPAMYLGTFGSSGEHRPLPLIVVSKEKAFTPDKARHLAKSIVLIQNGIHAGEIDGKDATLMILRDMALGGHEEILDAVTLVIVPIYNVDGHEHVSPYNRPNQDGPRKGMGFRTTSNGLDLNRDYLKLASEEARALIGLIASWRPHLHVDNHVTDGVDHDWVLTWSWAEAPQAPAPVDAWMRAHLPAALANTEKAGHRTGPYVDLKDRNDPTKGFSSWVGGPRYSSGYLPLRNRPSVLVETHSYKPYKQRVLATRDFLLTLLLEVAKDPKGLTKAVADAEAATVALGRADAPPSEIAVEYAEGETPDRIRFPVYAWEMKTSAVTGQPLLVYRRGEVKEIEVPWYHASKVAKALPRPRGYLVLPGWPQIENRLRWHGLRFEKLTAPTELDVETSRVSNPDPADAPYQGLTQVSAQVEHRTERRKIPAGALWVPADQPDFAVAVQLLEPESPESLFAWGLLSTVFEQKEYMDARVLEGHVAEMLKDPKVAAEWQAALKDEKLAGNPFARYQWWYRRTPYRDETVGLVPVFRVLTPFSPLAGSGR
jgi:Zinc carboxypeptidase